MAKKKIAARPDVVATKTELLAAHAAVKKQKLAPLPGTFKPGRGLAEVLRVIRATEATGIPERICLPLAQKLVETEPYMETFPYAMLEPLFDTARVLARFPEPACTTDPRVEEPHCRVRRGDVTIDGDLFVRGLLIVCGSLRVTGAIHAYGDDWSSGTIVVLGHVHAARMLALGPMAIGGTLTLTQGLITAYYHDTESTLCARKIQTPIWFDLGDNDGDEDSRVFGAVNKPITREPWLHERMPKYFNEHTNTGAWKQFDETFFRAAMKARDAKPAATQPAAKKRSAKKRR